MGRSLLIRQRFAIDPKRKILVLTSNVPGDGRLVTQGPTAGRLRSRPAGNEPGVIDLGGSQVERVANFRETIYLERFPERE